MDKNQFETFLGILKEVKGENLFNPYTDVCQFHDSGILSPHIRSNNLRQYFTILDKTDSLLIGEAPGYLGCRRTGLSFTDELTFNILKTLYHIDLKIATKSGKNKEQSATHVWSVLSKLEIPPFLWNIVPFHPYNAGNQLSNRTPTSKDHKLVKEAVDYFFENTQFTRIFAIGKVAKKTLTKMNYKVIDVRHPSYGGSTIFKNKIIANFEIKENPLTKFIVNSPIKNRKE